MDYIDQVEDHAPLGPQHQIEVSQPDVKIDDHDLLALVGERGAQRSGRCRLADAAFA